MTSKRLSHGFVYFLIIFVLGVILLGAFRQAPRSDELTFNALAEAIQQGKIQRIEVSDTNNLEITAHDGTIYQTTKDPSTSVYEQLAAFGVTPGQMADIDWVNTQSPNWQGLTLIFATLLPILLIVGVVYFMMRNTQGANNQALNFGKSKARMVNPDQPTVTFDDVAGAEESKEELYEVVEFLREPTKFVQLGARIPKGVLLVGPPGTGKTLLSKAVAGEAGVPFFSISGSEFVEMFVGVGASRVRDLFEKAKTHSPCIIFIDEIDAVGRQRGAGLGGSHDEREQTLNQILVEMDGFDTDTNIIIIAATNRPDILDPALLRPGRFDRRVVMDRPDVRGREAIFGVHVRGKPLASDVDLNTLARVTPGFVGADIENTVNEAAILAARRNKRIIEMVDFQEAIERVSIGPERRSRLISEQERRIVAYHEAGHALVGHYMPNCEPVLKVTIIPRGMAGGYTWSLGSDDTLISRARFLDMIAMALGGRVAEELVFDDVTTGASGDLRQVTRYARSMVTAYGMSDRLGPMAYGEKQEMVFLGREIGEQRDYSEAVAQEIDSEVRSIVSSGYEKARETLTTHYEALERVAETLMEVETLEREEFEAIVRGEEVDFSRKKAAKQQRSARSQPTAEKGRRGEDQGGTELPPAAPSPA